MVHALEVEWRTEHHSPAARPLVRCCTACGKPLPLTEDDNEEVFHSELAHYAPSLISESGTVIVVIDANPGSEGCPLKPREDHEASTIERHENRSFRVELSINVELNLEMTATSCALADGKIGNQEGRCSIGALL